MVENRRDAVLQSIRSALGREAEHLGNGGEKLKTALRDKADPGSRVEGDRCEELFLDGLTRAGALTARAETPGKAVETVLDYLRQRQLPLRLVCSTDPIVKGLPWPDGIILEHRSASADDKTAVTAAAAGIAETGSLVLRSDPATPASLNFLPDHFICLLPGDRILPDLEALWRSLRARGGAMPRALNLITGPSRTADVEQTLQMGAHGPRSVLVVLLPAM